MKRFECEGAQLLDTRDPFSFAKRHVAGSINIGLDGTFATWAGTLLDRERPVVLLAEPGREREAAMRLGRIGFDRVLGYLEGGPEAMDIPEADVVSVNRVTRRGFRWATLPGRSDSLSRNAAQLSRGSSTST